MELKLPTPEQLETVYEADLKVSFQDNLTSGRMPA